MATLRIFFALVAFLLFHHSLAEVFVVDGSSRQLDNTTFDYIVVGCGIAGLVVANRLSEDENVTVVCLEAGTL
jgi:ribulose 1,5-bisphosphate synthetase/thiazole synthase